MSYDPYIEEFIRSDYYNKKMKERGNKRSCFGFECFNSYEQDRKYATDILELEKKNRELIELEREKIRENCSHDEKYQQTNILVLCQREKGDILYTDFSYRNILDLVYKPLNIFLKPEEKCNLNIEYMTAGLNDEKDEMTHKMFFGYDIQNSEFLEFLKNHIGYYSYIIVGACPSLTQNKIANIKAISNLLNEKGKILFPLFKPGVKYDDWQRNFFNHTHFYFKYETDNPFIVMKKIPYGIVFDITEKDLNYNMKPKISKRKSKISKRKSKISKRKSKVPKRKSNPKSRKK